MRKQILIYSIVMCIMLLILTGCSIQAEEQSSSIEDKTDIEIEYLEDEILTIVNRYAKKEYNTESGINWEEISKDVDKINTSIDTIILDLSEVKLSNDDLVNFSNEVNNLNMAVSAGEELQFLQRVSYLYSLLPTYMEKYSQNKNKINIMKLKSLCVSSFVQSNFFDWENAKASIILAETKYKEMLEDVDYMQEYSYNLNKIYILVQEFKNAINIEEADLSRIKYLDFIEKI